MKVFSKLVKSVFGHNRSERRSSIVLLVLLFAVISVRILFPVSTVSVDGYPVYIAPDSASSGLKPATIPRNYPRQPDFPSTQQNNTINRQTELNSCDSAALESLPGLGPVLSARIVKFRALLGGFYSVEQLKEVYGLDGETYEKVAGFFSVDTSLVSRIKVKEADYRELIRLPYFTKDEVNAILRYRTISGGTIGSVDELVSNGVISVETSQKVVHYLDFE